MDNNSKPMIVLDAANIAWSHGHNESCSGIGLLNTIDYFRERGFSPIAFLPNKYLYNPKRPQSLISELERIEIEVKNDVIIPVPPLDDDDLYMLTFAQNKEVKLVSNDLFRDYITTSENELAGSWVRNNVVSYSFVGNEFFPNPKFLNYFSNISNQDSVVKQSEGTHKLTEGSKSKARKILHEAIEDADREIERELGFRYYCSKCFQGFTKWSYAHSHKLETGHGAYSCTECNAILPSPKSVKEHQQSTGHTTLTGTWVGQHEMRVKDIPQLSIELIRSSSIKGQELLSKVLSENKLERKEIRGFTTGRNAWPKNPIDTATIIQLLESRRNIQISWNGCKLEISNNSEIAKDRINTVLATMQKIFQPNSWREMIDWGAIRIDGTIFEKILIELQNLETPSLETDSDRWFQKIVEYFEDVKIYYASTPNYHLACAVCNIRFSKPKDLVEHKIRLEHNFFQCITCSKPFTAPSSVARHWKEHRHSVLDLHNEYENPELENSALNDDGSIDSFSDGKGCKFPIEPISCAATLLFLEKLRGQDISWNSEEFRKCKRVIGTIIKCFDPQSEKGMKLWNRKITWDRIPKPSEIVPILMGYCLIYSTNRGIGLADKEFLLKAYFSAVNKLIQNQSA